MREKELIGKVISVETGEVIDELYDSDKIVHKTSAQIKKEEYVREHVLNFNKGEGFVKTYGEATYMLYRILPSKEYAFLMGLNKYISFETCALKNGTGKNSHFMDLKELSEVMDIDYTRCSRIVNNLIKKGALGKFETGNIEDSIKKTCYIVNPYICINGNNPSKAVYEYFKESGWDKLIEEYNKKIMNKI